MRGRDCGPVIPPDRGEYPRLGSVPGGKLAVTGATGVALGGLMFSQAWLLAAAVALVLLGATGIRLGWRRGKTAKAR
jgi:hypothetical protein